MSSLTQGKSGGVVSRRVRVALENLPHEWKTNGSLDSWFNCAGGGNGRSPQKGISKPAGTLRIRWTRFHMQICLALCFC